MSANIWTNPWINDQALLAETLIAEALPAGSLYDEDMGLATPLRWSDGVEVASGKSH